MQLLSNEMRHFFFKKFLVAAIAPVVCSCTRDSFELAHTTHSISFFAFKDRIEMSAVVLRWIVVGWGIRRSWIALAS